MLKIGKRDFFSACLNSVECLNLASEIKKSPLLNFGSFIPAASRVI